MAATNKTVYICNVAAYHRGRCERKFCSVKSRSLRSSLPAFVATMFLITMPAIGRANSPETADNKDLLDLIQRIGSQCDLANLQELRLVIKGFFGVSLKRDSFENLLDRYNIRYAAKVSKQGTPFVGILEYNFYNQAYTGIGSRWHSATLYYQLPIGRRGAQRFWETLDKSFKRGEVFASEPPQPTHEICHSHGNTIRVLIGSAGDGSVGSLTFDQNHFLLAKP